MENYYENKTSENWENLTLANNFLFCKIMESDPELCRQLLEILLHIKIERLSPPQAERTVQVGIDSKSVRFDVYAKDEKRVFDIEMQTTSNKNLPKRARYYQSISDVESLSKGERYSNLRDTYIIFLCLEDIFKKGLPVYTFENICREDKNLLLNDRAFKVFFNAAECDKMASDEEKSFFKFLSGEGAMSDFTKNLEEKVLRAKKNAEWRRQYMTWQQTIDEEKDISFEQGKEAKAIEDAILLVKEFNVTPELAAKKMNAPLEKVLELLNSPHRALSLSCSSGSESPTASL